MKKYAVSIMVHNTVRHNFGSQVVIRHSAISTHANSEEEAYGIAYKICKDEFPTEDGWSEPNVSVVGFKEPSK